MALTAQISAFPTQTTPGTPVAFQCVVTNNGASTVFITSLEPSLKRTGGVVAHPAGNLGRIPLGPGFPNSVAPNGGQTTFKFNGNVGDPTQGDGGASPGTASYDVGATILASDGTTTLASTCTITSVPYDTRFRTGNGSYGPGVGTATLPAIPPLPTFPLTGAFQQNYWANSALFPVVL